ncbi:hypothetical protein TTHERM_000209309 (macronuclear) [Tetrahymena thermophila SB210]|uniref:Uncharacterized protein n=1 Tax=Tetrahymena thermophila (strain SB210) TaxID=312017 RepID=W7XHE8_TETTS|nr:hypothetical protein TTHERM_000209309 [Tetrahymena thermophila SB210]EWS76663.1 hypothetical protein TTHERM_000209309 [Tetrahymena thermophila SB210]|eukprot:XP_012650831.1 hypothetical protein TTHERM_000209309 [Tetrahymena thermophila SB210]
MQLHSYRKKLLQIAIKQQINERKMVKQVNQINIMMKQRTNYNNQNLLSKIQRIQYILDDQSDIQISEYTNKRGLLELGFQKGKLQFYQKIYEQTRQKKLIYAKQNAYRPAYNKFYSDDNIFYLNDKSIDIWFRDQCEKQVEVQWYNNRQSIHIWGLSVKKGNQTSISLMKELIQNPILSVQMLLNHCQAKSITMIHPYYFVQHNAPSHKAKDTVDYFKKNRNKFS